MIHQKEHDIRVVDKTYSTKIVLFHLHQCVFYVVISLYVDIYFALSMDYFLQMVVFFLSNLDTCYAFYY